TLMAHFAVKLLHEAGVPEAALQFLPGDGPTVGAALTRDPRVTGVVFTGSTETAWAINRALAARNAPIATLIAETGGQNALNGDGAREQLDKHAERMDKEAKLIKALPLPESCAHGSYFAPRAYEVDSLARLTHEVFGPVLHVIRYAAYDLDKVLADIQRTGFG